MALSSKQVCTSKCVVKSGSRSEDIVALAVTSGMHAVLTQGPAAAGSGVLFTRIHMRRSIGKDMRARVGQARRRARD